MTAAGNYIVDKQPEVIIHLGDHWDMHSLSAYDKGTLRGEGARINIDIEAGKAGMDALLSPIKAFNRRQKEKKKGPYNPRKVFLLGNHEERLMRYINHHPEQQGLMGYHQFELEQDGWEVHDYRKPVEINGIWYAHYFYNANTGQPYGGKASTKLSNIGFSFTQGHVQGKDIADKPLANGKTLRGLVVGSFYQHDEEYKGPQANNHWRGCILKNEVNDGDYSICELTLRYLREEWL